MRYFERPLPFLTVVTAYFKGNGKLDGKYLGTYPGSARMAKQEKVFAPPSEPVITQMAIRRHRRAG